MRRASVIISIFISAFLLFVILNTEQPRVYAVNVNDYGVVRDCSTDDTVAIQNAINALQQGDNTLYLPSGCYKVSSTLLFDTVVGVKIKGDGHGLNGTVLKVDGSVPAIQIDGLQFITLEDIGITYDTKPTGSYAIVIKDSFETQVRNVRIWYAYNGIKVVDSTETLLENINLRNLIGTNGIFYGTEGSTGSYGMIVRRIVADNPYPVAYTQTKTWTANTTYSLGDVIFADNKLYQVVQAGKSGTVQPSGTVGTTALQVFTDDLTDGTVKWRFVSANLIWLQMDSRAYSLRGESIVLLNGRYGLFSSDSVGSGTSYPTLVDLKSLECDHNHAGAIVLNNGAHFVFTGGFAGSSLTGNGIAVASTFQGGMKVSGMQIRGNWQYGVYVAGGRGSSLVGNEIGDNSQQGNGLFHGVWLGSDLKEFIAIGNNVGDSVDSGANKQGYGFRINGGVSDYIRIMDNTIRGNLTGKINNSSTGPNNEIQTK